MRSCTQRAMSMAFSIYIHIYVFRDARSFWRFFFYLLYAVLLNVVAAVVVVVVVIIIVVSPLQLFVTLHFLEFRLAKQSKAK